MILENRQADRRKENVAETQRESFSKSSEAMDISTKQVKYQKKPNTIVELSQVIIDVVKGTASAVYHLGEDFVLGIVQIVEDLPRTLEALGNMISRPIETAKYIGKAIYDSFIRDVIHGDAESRAHWFTYAIGTVFGFKGLDKAGKVSVQAAKQGAQKTGQKLDELLPYHPKHQLAMDGPVPYNVYDGVNLRDQLMVKAENVTRQEKGLKSKDKSSGKGTEEISLDMIRTVEKDILDQMESVGGHTLERHVGKTNEDLIKRAIQENVEAATSFTDKSTATKAIQENLRKNADDIAKWLNESDTRRKIFDVSHKGPIGKGALEDKKQVIYDLSNSRVVLVRDRTNELGFRILTGFPVVK